MNARKVQILMKFLLELDYRTFGKDVDACEVLPYMADMRNVPHIGTRHEPNQACILCSREHQRLAETTAMDRKTSGIWHVSKEGQACLDVNMTSRTKPESAIKAFLSAQQMTIPPA